MVSFARLAYDTPENINRTMFENSYDSVSFIEYQGAQCFLAMKDTECVISFRGTELQSPNDIAADVKINLVPFGRGNVHEGFRREYNKLKPFIYNLLRTNVVSIIRLVGHSLGAALATLAAVELQALYFVEIYTFGSPRVGDCNFVKDLSQTKHFRFVNNNDTVTNLPFFGYMHHGTCMYINAKGNLLEQPSLYRRILDAGVGRLLAWSSGRCFDGVYDHSILRYEYLLRAVY